MARPLRILHPGAWYHVTARGIERRAIFLDDRDRTHFVELLAAGVERFSLGLHAYVLMDNHYHLLLSLSQPNLSRAIQWLNVSYSVWFNRRHRRCGYLFQGRFKSVVVDPPSWGVGMSAYIHLNPVRISKMNLTKTDRQRARAGAGSLPPTARVQARLQRLRRYPWSSYRAFIGQAKCPPWLDCQTTIDMGGGEAKTRKANYQRYVEDQVREGLPRGPWEELQGQSFLGQPEFIRKIKQAGRAILKKTQTNAAPRWLKAVATWPDVVSAVERAYGQPWDEFRDQHNHGGRDLALSLARRTTGLTLREIAQLSGLASAANISIAIKRYEAKIKRSNPDRSIAKKAAQMLNVAL